MPGLEISLLCLLEVDDVPDGVKVIWFHVLVLQVKCVLPNVDTDDGFVRKKGVLVGSGDDLKLLGGLIVAEPTPTAALDGSSDTVHLTFELFKAAKVSNQRLLQRPVWEFSAILVRWRQVLPKEGMVDVTSSVELQSGLQSNEFLRGRSLMKGGLCRVQTVHIGLVVLSVMKFHDLLRDVWFKSVVSVWKFWKRVFSPRKHRGSPVHSGASEGASSGPRESRKQGHDR